MKAVGLEAFGDPDVLRVLDVPDPGPMPGRAVVTVVAATVNPTDLMLRSGKQAASMTQLSPPYIPGMEFAGHVHALGDGSTGVEIGQPVMGIINPRRPEGGAQSERLSVPFNSLVPLAASADLAEAATIPMNGLTALKAVEALNLRPGQVALVTGGAGGLGGYVIQLAKHAGLKVIADAKDADRELLRRLGADEIVPRGEGIAQAVRKLVPDGADGLVDAAVLGGAARSLVRDGGMCVSVRGLQGADDTRVRHHAVAVAQHAEDADALKELGRLMTEGVLTPPGRAAASDRAGRRSAPPRGGRRAPGPRRADVRGPNGARGRRVAGPWLRRAAARRPGRQGTGPCRPSAFADTYPGSVHPLLGEPSTGSFHGRKQTRTPELHCVPGGVDRPQANQSRNPPSGARMAAGEPAHSFEETLVLFLD